ncbi:homoserine dehydrogenase [Halalkalibacter krulwichiae]|uniref:Homoserine dehydrogenase n=1 Tax=Halalkalibacter krulwichiae TaxID=199441 RepID=A0A1X9M731_9BACI|nr:homoserine dehydrogenase [Halalkalibacter krulwichiae]ARK29228.1 Homoserine dehydrogenase [Halalkalibacter krulwichiae]
MINIGLIGYGTVGSGVYERLIETKEQIETLLGSQIRIASVLVKDKQKKRIVETDAMVTSDWHEFCQAAEFDIIFEAIGGVEPAFTYTSELLKKGVPVITANKKLVAEKGNVLEEMAKEQSTYYGYEAAVAGGIPIINALKGTLMTTSITRVAGILNGTTNYILTEMIDNHRAFSDVLLDAQERGYAESDPSDDIDGFDAWYKIRILSRLCFGEWPNVLDIPRVGITELEDWHVEIGERFGFKIKLMAEAVQEDKKIIGRVTPAFLTQTEALANVQGVLNAVVLQGDAIDQLLFVGPGAGKKATANSMVEDFLYHERSKDTTRRSILNNEKLSASSIVHELMFIRHDQREQALKWVKLMNVHVLDTCDHYEGEGWIICNSNSPSPFKHYPIYGDISSRKRLEAVHFSEARDALI